ncbi:MAG TPA: MmgE/PrpD family protein [Burkholderiales bacterium]|nr:MmgE/PrpD family protein [Burkholderiales bacterium]
MSTVLTDAPIVEADAPLAARIARTTASVSLDRLPSEVVEKTRVCLMDLIGCAFESKALPWSRQARAMTDAVSGGATIIGSARTVGFGDAAFVNAVMGHGLVREDMHAGSISHLGIVVLPTLFALAQMQRVRGCDFIAAAAVGYEVGGQIGRALIDADIARIHRPTGVCGPVAAAAAGARVLGLDAQATTSAIALAANTILGFNQWAHTGGSEMFFHAGFVARNALTAVRLAQAGGFASPSALDGEAGLFASFGKRADAAKVELFRATPEILTVYHKPVSACNFAQTPTQAALEIARKSGVKAGDIAAIRIRVPRAGALYPGCDATGPFAHVLQGKMSIQFNVAATLVTGSVSEKNFELLDDARVRRLIGLTTLEVDDALTRAYPGQQGGEVEVTGISATVHRARLSDVVNASADEVRRRFREAVSSAVGAARAARIEQAIEALDRSDDVGALVGLLQGEEPA